MGSFKKLAFTLGDPLKLPPVAESYLDCISLPNDEKGEPSQPLQNGAPCPFAISPIMYSEVRTFRNLTNGSDVKTVLDVELNLKGQNVEFLPGDTIGIIPQNSEHEVQALLRHLDLLDKSKELLKTSLKKNTTKKNAKLPQYIPVYSTAEELLKTCIEIRALPKKAFLRALGEHTSEEVEKRRLLELCSREGATEYQQFFMEGGYTLLDILEALPSCKPPLSLLLEHLPRLQSRTYSIASSPLDSAENIHIVLSVMEDARGRKGVCSGWLHSLSLKLADVTEKLGNLSLEETSKIKIPIYFRKVTNFRIPESISVPVIMIGPGTGVSPFIGFLRHRRAQYKSSDLPRGENWLYFGCRYADRDHIFKDEMLSYVQDGIISKLFTSLSRDTSAGVPKYVQENFLLHKQDFVDQMLTKNCCVFLCGEATKTVKDIEEAILHCIRDVKGLSENEAKDILKDLENTGRFLKDNWT